MIWGMENKDVRSPRSRRAFLSASAVTAVAVPLLSGTALAETDPALATRHPIPGLRAMLREIDPDRIKATILKLVSFGTRHTASSQTDPVRGIGAATTWVFEQMQAIAATSGGRMTVQKQTFTQPVSSNIPVPTTITNVIATLKGTASPERFYVMTGHLDSRVTDVLDFTSDAPGADDDGSGVAVVLELARLFATHQFPGTLVFATVAGEEQGLYGSAYMAAQMAAAGNDVQGMFSNDIVGASQAWDGTRPDPHTVRLFVEGIPTAATPAQISLMQSVGGENDGVTHQLARFVTDVAPPELTGMNVRVIWRRDRYLRGSDHISFQSQGYPAARFTEPRENFNHEHRDVQVVDGVQFGDLIAVRGLRLHRPGGQGERRRAVGAGHQPRHAQEPADPHDAAGGLLRHQPHHAQLERQPRTRPGRLRGGDARDHRGGLDQRDRRRQRHLGHAEHLQGQRAVRPARHGQGRPPQPGRLPAGSELAAAPGRAPLRAFPARARPSGTVRRVPPVWIGLTLAFASALVTNTAYSLEHDAAARLPPLSPRRPFRSVQVLLRDRRWLVAFGAESAGWLMYVAALRLAPLSLVQAVVASGVAVLAFATARGHPSRLARREQLAVVLAIAGLVLLALSLVDTAESDQHPR